MTASEPLMRERAYKEKEKEPTFALVPFYHVIVMLSFIVVFYLLIITKEFLHLEMQITFGPSRSTERLSRLWLFFFFVVLLLAR